MSLKLHGENGITYAFFCELAKNKMVIDFLKQIRWVGEDPNIAKINEKCIQIHLFPSFGRGYGFGEPDVVLLTDKYYIFIEIKTNTFEKTIDPQIRDAIENNKFTKKIAERRKGITYQLERFYSMGYVLANRNKEHVGEGSRIEGKLLICGEKKTLKMETKSEEYIKFINAMIDIGSEFYIVCLTEDRQSPIDWIEDYVSWVNNCVNTYLEKEIIKSNKFGWIGFDIIEGYARDPNFKLTKGALDMLKLLK